MDREQEEMQSLGFFGICKEASKIILSWKRIFTQITLTLILPLSIIFLIYVQVSNLVYWKLSTTDDFTKSFIFSLLQFPLLCLLLLFSLPSTSAVVYTVASIYTAKDVTFKRVMSAVPVVWCRLASNISPVFAIVLAGNMLTTELASAFKDIASWVETGSGVAVVLSVMIVVLQIIGSVYFAVTLLLAGVVAVLEDSPPEDRCGVLEMVKSNRLMKGKMALSIFLLFTPVVSLVSIGVLFVEMGVNRWSVSRVEGAAFGVLCLFLLSCLILFWLVVQTVFYFVCKTCHNENIDKSALADRLAVYGKSRRKVFANESQDVQQEQNQV